MSNRTRPDSKMPPLARECWLHRRRSICLFALAFWTFSIIHQVLDMGKPYTFPSTEDRIVMLSYAMGIWIFATLAKDCKQLLERLFYCVGIVDFAIVGIRGAIPMSGVAVWACSLLNTALSAIEIALCLAILLGHFRVRTPKPDSQT